MKYPLSPQSTTSSFHRNLRGSPVISTIKRYVELGVDDFDVTIAEYKPTIIIENVDIGSRSY